MRKLTYYVACSADRFIAAEDGSFDALMTEGEHLTELAASYPETFPAHARAMFGARDGNRRFDAVLMGRKTYEVGLPLGVTSPYPHLEQYVFSRTLGRVPGDVELVSGDPLAFVRELKRREGLGVWLCGGGELAARLFPEIDELILKVNPVVLGRGIPLFAGPVETTRLELAEARSFDNGFLVTRYRVRR